MAKGSDERNERAKTLRRNIKAAKESGNYKSARKQYVTRKRGGAATRISDEARDKLVKENKERSAKRKAVNKSKQMKSSQARADKKAPKTQSGGSGGGKKPPTRTKTDYKGGGRSRKVLSRNVIEAKPNKPVGSSTPNKPQATSYNTSSRYGKSKMPSQTGGATSYSAPKKPRTTAQGVNKRTVPTSVGKSEAKRTADRIKKGERNQSNIKIRKPKPAQIGQRTNAAGGSQPPPRPKAPGAALNQGPKTAPGYNKNAANAARNKAASNASARATQASKILNRGAKPTVKGAAKAIAGGAAKGARKGGGAGIAIGALVGAAEYAGQFNQGEGRSTGGRTGAAQRNRAKSKEGTKMERGQRVHMGFHHMPVNKATSIKVVKKASEGNKSKPKKTFDEKKWRSEYRAKQAARKADFYSKTKTGAAEAASKANPSANTRKSSDSVHRQHAPQGNESRNHSWASRPDVNKNLKRMANKRT